MLTYSYNPDILTIKETANGDDLELQIQIVQENPYLERFKKIQRYFEDDEVYTDIMFYGFEDHRYQVIIRKQFYVNFILELMKHRLLNKVEWT